MSDPRLFQPMPGHCCPYCGKPVGYLGRAIAWLLGTGFHGCDASNIAPPAPQADVRVTISRDEALRFLECACRNWQRVPKLSADDIEDVATELSRFAKAHVHAALAATEGSADV